MIDYVKILFQDIDIKRLYNLDALDFENAVSKSTGALSTNKDIAKYHYCKVIIYESGKVYFSGSIHKLWNSLNNVKAPNHKKIKPYKGFNGNQFILSNIVEMRKHLEKLFDCQPNQMIFQNIEFGVNTTPNFDPQLFIKGLLYHNGILFEFRHKGYFAQVEHQRYLIKIYNKSNQYGMTEPTLRVELKVIKTEDILSTGIKTFADIKTSTLNNANKLLLKRFDEVVCYDNTISKDNLTERQKQTLDRYSNPRYWIDTLNPRNRIHNKKKLREYILKYSTNLKLQVANNIEQKFDIINRLSEHPKFDIINHSSIGLNIPNSTPQYNTNKLSEFEGKKCIVTGLNISMQKEDSFLISHTGLKFYFETNKKEFLRLQNKYLSKKWMCASFDIQIKELAHNIRNKVNNTRLMRKRIFNPNQTPLF